MITIWMNHWFSTAINIIELLKAGGDDLHIIGTNENAYSVIKNYCDEWYEEPVLSDKDYVDFCIGFCKSHHVDVFMPRRGMLAISKEKVRFEEIGVKVMLDDYDKIALLNHKERAYDYFKANGIGSVPDYEIVTTPDQFLGAYHRLKENYSQVCFKFAKDEGGKSFRLIDNQRKGYAALFKKQNTRMTLDDVMSALKERDEFASIMIMPFLPDEEISVDCLNTKQGLIALPRVKGNEKYETIEYDQSILDLCQRFQESFGLECPYNIQFKYLNGIPFFLEVNTRMSGGIHMSCFASGINIPLIALKKLLGEDLPWHSERKSEIVAQVLIPVTIKR